MTEPPRRATEGVAQSVICSVSYKCKKNAPTIVWNYSDMQSSTAIEKLSIDTYEARSNLTFIGSLDDDGKTLTCTAQFTTGKSSDSGTIHIQSEYRFSPGGTRGQTVAHLLRGNLSSELVNEGFYFSEYEKPPEDNKGKEGGFASQLMLLMLCVVKLVVWCWRLCLVAWSSPDSVPYSGWGGSFQVHRPDPLLRGHSLQLPAGEHAHDKGHLDQTKWRQNLPQRPESGDRPFQRPYPYFGESGRRELFIGDRWHQGFWQRALLLLRREQSCQIQIQ